MEGLQPEQMTVDPVAVAQPLPQISVSEEGYQTPVSELAAANKANKFSIGFPKSSITNTSALTMLLQGKEGDLRKQAAAELDYQNSIQQQKAINAIAAKQGPLTLPQQLLIKDIISKKQANPDTVLEENYAQAFMQTLVKTAQDRPYGDLAVSLKNLSSSNAEVSKGTDLKTRNERIDTWAEKAQSAYDAQSWGGFAIDFAKGLTSVYGEAKLRGQVSGGLSSPVKGLLAENMRQQWQDLMFMPFDEFNTKGEAIVDKLIKDNPSMAMLWLSAGKGMSNEDRFLVNAFPLLDLSLLGDVAKLGKGAVNVVRLRNVASTAVKTFLKDKEGIVSPAIIKEAAGDIQGAAIEQFAAETVRPESKTTFIKSMSDIFNAAKAGLEDLGFPGTTGGYRQELLNRMRESSSKIFGNVMNAVQNSMKLEQLQAALASKRVAAQIAEDMVKDYPGVDNMVFKHELVKDQASGQWFLELHLLNNNGKMFSSEKVARSVVDRLGLGEVKIVEAAGPPKPVKVSTTKAEQAKYLSQEDATRIFNVENAIDWQPSFKRTDLAPPPSSTIRQQGAGFYIVKSKPVPHQADFVRDTLLETTATRTPNSTLNALGGYLGRFRTPHETLALENMVNREIATYGNAVFYNAIKDLAKDINEAKGWAFTDKRAKWNEWKRAMTAMDNIRSPETGEKGIQHAFSTPGELRDLYQQTVGRLPDEQEVKASFAYRNRDIIQEQLKKFTKAKNQLREGGSNWTLSGLQEATETVKSAGTIKKVSFNGVQEKERPTSGTMLIMHKGELGLTSINEGTFRDATKLKSSGGLGKTLDEALETGALKLVRILEPDEYPLEGMFNPGKSIQGQAVEGLRITHVISSALEDKPLSWDHIKVNRTANTDYDHYIAQAHVKFNPVTNQHEYLGDRTIAGFNIRAASHQVAEQLDNVRLLLKAGHEDAAQEYYRNSTLPMEYDMIKRWFTGDVTTEGLSIAPRLNLEEKIRTVPHGKMVNEVDTEMLERYKAQGKTFVDRTKETYGQIRLHDPYDIFSLRNAGTKDNPEWNVAPIKYIDPVTSINRSLIGVINDIHLNDYKVASVEHWIEEAKDLMKVTQAQLRAAPAYYFHNPQWLSGLSGEQIIKKTNLETAQMQITQFLGVKDAHTTFLHATAQMLADSIYTKFGEKPVLLATADKLPLLRDPFQFIRGAVFHPVVGLFSIPALLSQLTTFATIAGVSGWGKAASGTYATAMHVWSRINRNPEIMAQFDKMASKMGWKPGELTEAHTLLTNNGFEHVGSEHIYRDATSQYNLVGNAANTFLDAGSWFFREGDRTGRTGAWYTAYKEFRDANPVKKITETDERWILNRADLLSGNMSRASASAIQKGIMSIPTQFYSYAVRQAELMIGKRLTDLEKARLFGTYALLYGVPAAFGSFTLGIGSDYIMQNAIERGYVADSPDNSKWNTLLTEGLPALTMQMMTGNLYNVGQRFAGANGPVTDVLRSDKSLWDILGGASFSTISKSISGMDGIASALSDAIHGEGPLKFKPDDFIEPLKGISSVRNVDRLYMALQTGKWLSSKEMELGDASPLNAIFMSLTGLGPQSSATVGWTIANIEQEKAIQQEGLQIFIKEYRRGLRELDRDNPDQTVDYWQRAFRALRQRGYPQEDWGKAVSIANEGEEELASRVTQKYLLKHVPENVAGILYNTGRKKEAFEALQQFMRAKQ